MVKFQMKYILPIGILVIFLFVGIIIVNSWLAERMVGPCMSRTNVYMPVIEQFGPEYVIFTGNQNRLAENGTYRFGDDLANFSVRLLKIDDREATFLIMIKELNAYDPRDTLPHTMKSRCTLVINRDERMFQPRFRSVLVQPSDFDESWRVAQYTEFVYEYLPTQSPIDQTRILLSVEHNSVPYIINLSLYKYRSEFSAANSFVAELRHNDLDPITDATNFTSQTQNFYEGCDPIESDNCSYIAQYEEYLISISMRVLRGFWTQDSRIAVADWHYLLEQVETRLLPTP